MISLLLQYLLACIVYWSSYFYIRPRAVRSHFFAFLYLLNLLLGLIIVAVSARTVIDVTGKQDNLLIFSSVGVGFGMILHHLSTLKGKYQWKGVFSPRTKLSFVHGVFSHLLTFVCFGLFGFSGGQLLLANSYSLLDTTIIYVFTISMEYVALLGIINGFRMLKP